MLVSANDKARVAVEDNSAFTENPAEIANPPTHMEIAIMLNVSRETVTRVFQSLQNRQIVRRDGPTKLLIIDPKALKQLAEGKTTP